MNIVGMANRLVEVIDHFELPKDGWSVSFREKKVTATFSSSKLDIEARKRIEAGSGYHYETGDFTRSIDGNIYGAALKVTEKKSGTRDFIVELSFESWLLPSPPPKEEA